MHNCTNSLRKQITIFLKQIFHNLFEIKISQIFHNYFQQCFENISHIFSGGAHHVQLHGVSDKDNLKQGAR